MIFKLCNNGKSVVGTREDGVMVSYSIEAEEYKKWVLDGGIPLPEDVVPAPTVVTMRQARLALLEQGLLATVDTAIAGGSDEAMKIEWEYATEVKRDWASLIAMANALGMTDTDLDNLFLLASTK